MGIPQTLTEANALKGFGVCSSRALELTHADEQTRTHAHSTCRAHTHTPEVNKLHNCAHSTFGRNLASQTILLILLEQKISRSLSAAEKPLFLQFDRKFNTAPNAIRYTQSKHGIPYTYMKSIAIAGVVLCVNVTATVHNRWPNNIPIALASRKTRDDERTAFTQHLWCDSQMLDKLIEKCRFTL